MISQQSTPSTLLAATTGLDTGIEEYRAMAWKRRYAHLEKLCDWLADHGLYSTLTDDPWLRVHLSGTAGDTVYVKPHDGQDVFCWTSRTVHPVTDPAGAARRIATQLRHEAGLS